MLSRLLTAVISQKSNRGRHQRAQPHIVEGIRIRRKTADPVKVLDLTTSKDAPAKSGPEVHGNDVAKEQKRLQQQQL